MNNRVVLKYGGTSVADMDLIKKVALSVKERVETGREVVVVASAMGKKTDELIRLAKETGGMLNRRELDHLLSTGEQQTISLLAMTLSSIGVDAISLTGFQAGFQTTNHHTKSRIVDIDVERIDRHLSEGKVVIVAGFQGISEDGDITTLGRGGSDTSAVAIAAKLKCDCYIYTDVDGVYTVDPRVYKEAKKIHQISYEEMMELATLGAGVLEPRSVELASKYNVNLFLGKSLEEDHSKGTRIVSEQMLFEDKPITGISLIDEIAMVSFEGLKNDMREVSTLFRLVSDKNINIDMITQNIDENGHIVVSFSCHNEDLPLVNELIVENRQLFKEAKIDQNTQLAKLSVVGVGMKSHFGVAADFFETLSNADVSFYHVTTSEISISCSIDQMNKMRAVEALAGRFKL
jgi:aspartate kinase